MADHLVLEASQTLILSTNDIPILEAADLSRQNLRMILNYVYEETKHIYTIALPLIIAGILIYGKSLTSMLFMGELGKDILAGGSLSAGIANITGYSILFGLSTCMEGMSSQAYGAQQWRRMTQTLHRTILMLLLISIPISIFWFNIEPVLLLLGQEPVISSIASSHLAFVIPDLLFLSFINPLKNHLRARKTTRPLMITAIISLMCHVPVNYVMVNVCGFGVRGIAAATSINDFTLLCMLFFYTYRADNSIVHLSSWEEDEDEDEEGEGEGEGGSVNCLHEWKKILRLAIPSCLSVCLEWWWYELMTLLSGLLPNSTESLASMAILIQATSFLYIFPSSFSSAISTCVGNNLGSNQPKKARNSSIVALICAFFTSFIAMGVMICMRKSWGRIFTDDEAVLSLTAAALPLVGLCELGNCPQTTVCGVFRGSARPTLSAMINLGSFYGVGLPVTVILGFTMGKGFVGLWLGLLSAQIVCTVITIIALKLTDWEKQVNRAHELMGVFQPN